VLVLVLVLVLIGLPWRMKCCLDPQAYDVKDAFVKSIYGRVFGWIVSHINEMLAPGLAFSGHHGESRLIGVL
jgi:myosin heavy subunit